MLAAAPWSRDVDLQAVLLAVVLAARAVAPADVSSGVAAGLDGLAVLGVVLLVRPRD